jgi:hypothetical protein
MSLVLWPAVITLAITLLRLVGELQGWPRLLFNPAAGGGGALVGISWLPIVFGPWFAWKLSQQGKGPASAWRAAGLALLAFLLAAGTFASIGVLGLPPASFLVAFAVSLGLAFVPWKAWPELAKTLFAYALAARVPVAIVMLFAIYRSWGTHYDVLPPNPTPELQSAGPLARWFYTGLLPQMTIWIANTVLVGTLLGALVVAVAKPARRP